MNTLRILVNSAPSGANAWFWLAQDLGFFAAEDVAVELSAGSGAYGAAERLMSEPFDLAFGDFSPLIGLTVEHPGEAPIAVYSIYNNSPSVIGMPRGDTPGAPADLVGKVLLGHASDVALRTFPCFAAAAGIDAATVTIKLSAAPMLDMLLEMLAGGADGVFGYYTSQTAVLRAREPTLPDRMQFLRYPDTVADLYGSMIMASRTALRDQPHAVRAVLRAVNRGLKATILEPRAAVQAVTRRVATLSPDIEFQRISDMIARDILHPEVRDVGLGGVDPARLRRAIALLADAANLRRPAVDEIFLPDFLPASQTRLWGRRDSPGPW